MLFYSLPKEKRKLIVESIFNNIYEGVANNKIEIIGKYFSDDDTYIRKAAYQSLGKIFFQHQNLQKKIIRVIKKFLTDEDFKVRQATINAAGEIGINDFNSVEIFFDKTIFDRHHSVRNAVIGSVKKMGDKNPKAILKWAEKYIHHPDKEIRREVCHGIELRGRTHPQDILPLLKKLQFDKTARVRNTLVHVLGQISYKEGCLKILIDELNNWDNKELVALVIHEIIDVHKRYKRFSALSAEQAKEYIHEYLSLSDNQHARAASIK